MSTKFSPNAFHRGISSHLQKLWGMGNRVWGMGNTRPPREWDWGMGNRLVNGEWGLGNYYTLFICTLNLTQEMGIGEWGMYSEFYIYGMGNLTFKKGSSSDLQKWRGMGNGFQNGEWIRVKVKTQKTSPKIENSSFEFRSTFWSFDQFFDENFILEQLKKFLAVPHPLSIIPISHP